MISLVIKAGNANGLRMLGTNKLFLPTLALPKFLKRKEFGLC